MPEITRIGARVDWEAMAKGYGTMLASVIPHLKAIHKELDEHRAGINAIPERLERSIVDTVERAVARAIKDQGEDLRKELTARVNSKFRDEMPSAEEIVEGLADEVRDGVREVVEEAVERTGPYPRVSTLPGFPAPAPLADKRSDSDRVRGVIDEQALADDGRRYRGLRKWLIGVASGVAVAMVVGALALIWRMGVAVEQAHLQGVAEGRAERAAEKTPEAPQTPADVPAAPPPVAPASPAASSRRH